MGPRRPTTTTEGWSKMSAAGGRHYGEPSNKNVDANQVHLSYSTHGSGGHFTNVNEGERPVLIEELIDSVTVFPDHLEVTVGGAPPLMVLSSEVGLGESENVRVGGPTRNSAPRRPVVVDSGWSELHLAG